MSNSDSDQQLIRDWWSARRGNYNKGLVIAGVLAFILYAVLGEALIAPYDDEFEITLFTILFQGIGYLIMMGIANLFYNLGAFADRNFNTTNSIRFREWLYKFGFWFSFALPFLVPVSVVILYLARQH